MAQIVTHAIVLRRVNYRENDRMLTLFSPNLGRIDALCRGCRRQKSPLLAASELFCAGEYVLYQSREHVTVTGCMVTDSYYPLRDDYERLSHGVYILELCAAGIQPAQENERLFLLLLRSLAHLSYGQTKPRRVTVVFLMGLLSLLGFRPQVGRCCRCRQTITGAAAFSTEAGGVLCPTCGAGEKCRLTPEDVVYLQAIMRRGLDTLSEEGDCPDALFEALQAMAEDRLGTAIRAGHMLP